MWGLFMSRFSRSSKKENQLISKSDFERQTLRLNTLEVQLKKLLAFESNIRLSMMGEGSNNQAGIQQRNALIDNEKTIISKKDFNTYLNKLDDIKRKIIKLEDTVKAIDSQIAMYSFSLNDGPLNERQLFKQIDKYLSDKLKEQHNKERKMEERIRKLESMVLDGINEKEKYFNKSTVDKSTSIRREPDTPLFAKSKKQMEEDYRACTSNIMNELNNLVSNYQIINNVQAEQQTKIHEVEEKTNLLMKRYSEVDGVENTQNNREIQSLYIDKIYIDKYELTNNIDQLGIRELSGALNIGATYGKEVVPKEVTDDIRKQFNNIKTDNAEKEKEKEKEGEQEKYNSGEFHQSKNNSPEDFTKEEEPFTIVDIEGE